MIIYIIIFSEFGGNDYKQIDSWQSKTSGREECESYYVTYDVLKHSKKNNFHLEISLYPLVLICDLFRSILAVKEVEFRGNTYYMSWTNVPATKKKGKKSHI